MAVAADTIPTTRATKRTVVVDLVAWPALVAFLTERDIRLIQIPCGPEQMPRYRTTGATAPAVTAGLTTRELEVLHRMARGQKNAEIGKALFLSEDTIKCHARTMFRKLGVRDRAHAVDAGWRLGILGGPA
jgi:DNA-binding NarL/FixJ family response regulator